MDLRGIEAFVGVAEYGSISRASRHLGIVQPALSRHVQRLELELGAPLLVRHPQGVSLTPTGERFLVHCRRILEEVAKAAGVTGTEAYDPVRLGVPPTLCPLLAPGIVRRCYAGAPFVKLKISSKFSESLLAGIQAGDLDLAITTKKETARRLKSAQILVEPLVVVQPAASDTHPSMTLNDLSSTPVVITETMREVVDRQLLRHDVALSVGLEVEGMEAVRRILLNGIGVSIGPISMFRDDIDAGDITVVSLSDFFLSRTIFLTHLADMRPTPPLRALIGFVREEITGQADLGAFSLTARSLAHVSDNSGGRRERNDRSASVVADRMDRSA